RSLNGLTLTRFTPPPASQTPRQSNARSPLSGVDSTLLSGVNPLQVTSLNRLMPPLARPYRSIGPCDCTHLFIPVLSTWMLPVQSASIPEFDVSKWVHTSPSSLLIPTLADAHSLPFSSYASL